MLLNAKANIAAVDHYYNTPLVGVPSWPVHSFAWSILVL